MANQITETNIKQPIQKLLENPPFSEKLRPAKDSNPREYQLKAFDEVKGVKPFHADFAYLTNKDDWIFIEDDSKGICLSNLLKYWAWIRHEKPKNDVHMIQIISPDKSAWIELCRMLSEELKLKEEMSHFHHEIITTKNWPANGGEWIEKLRTKLEEIV